jgi:sterol desaturase/sphingolipid hydroxylase (fatty acid hydroxylase superfamily)
MFLAPQIAAWVWPEVLRLMEENQWQNWQVYFFGSWAWSALIVLITNVVMWAIYHSEVPFFERYKITNDPWPWNENKEEWNKLVKKSILLVAFNNLVSLPLALMAMVYINNFEVKLSFAVEDLPDWKTLMFTIAFCMLCEDLTFHFTHRLLHWKKIYPYIHKIHHTHVTTIGIAAEYSHPIEFIFGNIVPSGVGGMILGYNMHFTTFLLWSLVRLGETLDGHCGYEFSWSPYRLIPFSTSASYHNFHHSHNIGNFSSFFSLWDTIFG